MVAFITDPSDFSSFVSVWKC